MKECFVENNLRASSLEKIAIINSIVKEYTEDGYKLTLRQLYYQLVKENIIPNDQKEYAKLSTLLKKGRMMGLVDFDVIEDRIRTPDIPFSANSPKNAIELVAEQYRVNRQEGQPKYIEVWCEKDALSNILSRVTKEYHLNLMVNRGYSSCSAMYDAHNRFDYNENYKHPEGSVLIYLGDFDPSGLDMVRDIDDRLMEFNTFVEVEHVALTYDQVEEYNPPPNPAKWKDPRAKDYIKQYGEISWEVDTLNPKILNEILKNAIEKHLNFRQFNKMMMKEKEDKKILANIIEDLE